MAGTSDARRPDANTATAPEADMAKVCMSCSGSEFSELTSVCVRVRLFRSLQGGISYIL